MLSAVWTLQVSNNDHHKWIFSALFLNNKLFFNSLTKSPHRLPQHSMQRQRTLVNAEHKCATEILGVNADPTCWGLEKLPHVAWRPLGVSFWEKNLKEWVTVTRQLTYSLYRLNNSDFIIIFNVLHLTTVNNQSRTDRQKANELTVLWRSGSKEWWASRYPGTRSSKPA